MKKVGWLLPVILTLTGCATSGSGERSGQTLSQALTSLGAAPALAGASMGLIVRDANSGKVLYQTHSELRMVPASNMKLLTSVAAFGILGPDYRFETRLLTNGRQHGNILQGDKATAIRLCNPPISTCSRLSLRSGESGKFTGDCC